MEQGLGPPAQLRRPHSPITLLSAQNDDVLLASVAVLFCGPMYAAAVGLRCEATPNTGEVLEEKVVAADVEVEIMQLLHCPFHMLNWIGLQC